MSHCTSLSTFFVWMYTIIFYFSLLRFLFASNFCDSQVSSLFYVNISPGVYHQYYHQSSHQNVQVSFFLGPFYFQCSSDLSWKSRIVSGLMFSFFRPLLETENSFRTNFFHSESVSHFPFPVYFSNSYFFLFQLSSYGSRSVCSWYDS